MSDTDRWNTKKLIFLLKLHFDVHIGCWKRLKNSWRLEHCLNACFKTIESVLVVLYINMKKILIWVLLLNCTRMRSTAHAPHVIQSKGVNHSLALCWKEQVHWSICKKNSLLFNLCILLCNQSNPDHNIILWIYICWYYRVIPKVITKFPCFLQYVILQLFLSCMQ